MDIMEKIRSLQTQISELTAQVNVLVQRTCDKNAHQAVNSSYSNVVQKTIELSDSNSSVSILPQKNVCDQRTLITENNKARDNSKNNLGHSDQSTKNSQSVTNSKTSQLNTRRDLHSKGRNSTKEISPSSSPDNGKTLNTLLIGDSILHGINLKGLKRNVHKHAVSGANIDTMLCDIKMFDLKTFSTIISYIGGNDVANACDLELYEEKYDQLLRYIKKENAACKIIMCSIGPRRDVQDCEITQLNEIINGLAREHGHTLADIFSAFHEKDGTVCERFYQYDSIHINPSGIKRFMRVLHDINDIVMDFDHCNFPRKSGYGNRVGYRRNYLKQRGRGLYKRSVKCLKCGENNHETLKCRHKNQLKCHNCNFYGHKSSLCENEL